MNEKVNKYGNNDNLDLLSELNVGLNDIENGKTLPHTAAIRAVKEIRKRRKESRKSE